MKYQRSTYSCGPASVVNAVRVFGQNVNEYTVRGYAGTDKHGTDENGIMNALRELGYSASSYQTDSSNNAWQWLTGQLIHGSPVILCSEAWQHWVVIVGTLGDRVVLIDSSNTKRNRKENGVKILTKTQLIRTWHNARKNIEGRLYAIAVGKK